MQTRPMTPRSLRFDRSPLSVCTLALTATLLQPLDDAIAGDYELLREQTYAHRTSGALKGDLYLPSASKETVPAVVMIHGGGWRSGGVGDMERFARKVVKAGFAVFNITYRLAPAHKFPAQLEDVQEAVRWLRANAGSYGIDPDRIGAWGYSAGAHLAMLLGTVDDDATGGDGARNISARIGAVVAGAGPTDLREYPDNHYVVDLMPGNADESLFELASPVASVDAGDAPMFLYHGKHDMIVAFSNSANMHRALRDAGVDARLKPMWFGHIVTYLFGGSAVTDGIEFLHTHL